MKKEFYTLDCSCCEGIKFIFDEEEFLKGFEIDFILNIFKAIKENSKNPLKYIHRELTLLELKRLEKTLKEIKNILK